MKKFLAACLYLCTIPSAFAEIGSGLYLTIGAGSGWLQAGELIDYNLNYEDEFFNNTNPNEFDQAVLNNFNESAEYNYGNQSVLAGRAAFGYLWELFDGEPKKVGGALYTINATLGLEVGYRIFGKVTNDLEKVVPNSDFGIDSEFTIENASEDINNQAIDLSAVLRLPFTEDSRLALLLKGGAAYNIFNIDTTIQGEASKDAEPPITPFPYNRTIEESETHDEFLPVVGAGLEWMFYDHFGLSVEYSAIMGSSHDADSELLSGNIIIRI
jgi:opacity protein-like surface antigen